MAGDPESVASSSKSHLVNNLDEIETTLEWHRIVHPNLETLISCRVGHTLVSTKDGKVTMIGGGNHEGPLGELWELDLRSRGIESLITIEKRKMMDEFKGRYEFFSAKEEQEEEGREHRIWIFGGADSKSSMNDVLFIEDNQIIETIFRNSDDTTPSPRTQGHNTSLVEIKGESGIVRYIAVFAGGLKGEKAVADGNLYLYNVEEHVWSIVPTKSDTPPITQGHAITSFGSKVFVHGGINEMTLYEGLYMIDLQEATPSLSKPISWVLLENPDKKPQGRAAHGMARSPEDSPKSFYIFGGLGENGGLNDLWRFDVESKTWTELINPNEKDVGFHPCPRFDFAFTSVRTITGDPDEQESLVYKDYLLVHGGMNSQGDLYSDMWALQL